MLLCLIPALQAKFHWAQEAPLYGAYTPAPNPEFSKEGVLAGTFQPALERYLEDNIGFRGWLIRLRNQLSLSLLGVARSSDLVVGQDLVLFQPSPVAAAQGKDFLGDEEVAYRVRRLRAVQEALARRGIPLLFVMAPNKARYQPETLPAAFRQSQTNRTNYTAFVREMKAQQINLLDAAHLFGLWKDTTRYPLFPKGGTHWSGYGAALVADTLFARIEQTGRFDLVNFRRHGPVVVRTDSLRFTDSDLSDPMNLVFPYRHHPTAYPTVTFDSLRAGQQRPNLLIIGDSFNWAFMQFYPYLQTLFAPESRFWGIDGTIFVYNKKYTGTGENLGQLDFRREIESRNFLLLLMTEHNLPNHTLIDRLYDLYYPLPTAAQARVAQIQQQLEANPRYQQRLWQQQYSGSHALADSLHAQALAQYDRELLQPR
ncbi:alginate O-acetyltransferase AlgX-related protein [Hymenobacter daecheongensis]|uniref:alginate O-acetyltransferase AlgX-related protein n=1 Tax=Hymenobacter daecheongensis TaxID=496053 RepID=UPI0009354A09|nr:hypothetical protein [Hymenobacter daecheongensis]